MNRTVTTILAAGLILAAAASGQTPTPTERSDVNPLGLFIDHATLGVADLQKQADWYQRFLGFETGTLNHTPQFDVRHLHIPGFRLDLLQQTGSTRPTPTMGFDKQGWLHIVLGTRDLEAVYQRLTKMGARISPRRNQQDKLVVILVEDPEGNRVEITQR